MSKMEGEGSAQKIKKSTIQNIDFLRWGVGGNPDFQGFSKCKCSLNDSVKQKISWLGGMEWLLVWVDLVWCVYEFNFRPLAILVVVVAGRKQSQILVLGLGFWHVSMHVHVNIFHTYS